jgi:3-hydroxyisobutyrate dehydrogenase-like beta-hydroxyacid dehydrogenase
VAKVTIGLLHPGAMGAAVGHAATAAGAEVRWLPAGRSPASAARAAGFVPADTLADCDLIISVCPPAAARDVAHQVAGTGFTGVYLDANAINPDRARRIAELLDARGITMVDGGIVGPPPRRAGTTRLYLSGPDDAVRRLHAVFDGGVLRTEVLPGEVGRASALKLAFAAYNKISMVLAAQAGALAEGYGVRAELLDLAADVLPDTPLGRPERLSGAGAKAWRWAPEIREIADACAAAGVPGALPEAAAALLDRWAGHKDTDTVTLDELLADLTDH